MLAMSLYSAASFAAAKDVKPTAMTMTSTSANSFLAVFMFFLLIIFPFLGGVYSGNKMPENENEPKKAYNAANTTAKKEPAKAVLRTSYCQLI